MKLCSKSSTYACSCKFSWKTFRFIQKKEIGVDPECECGIRCFCFVDFSNAKSRSLTLTTVSTELFPLRGKINALSLKLIFSVKLHPFFLHPIFLLSSICSPSFLALITTTLWTSPNGGTSDHDVLLVGPISSCYRWHHNPFTKRKYSYCLFTVDGVLILVIFFEELKSHFMQIYFITFKKLLAYSWDWTWVPTGNNLWTDQAGPGKNYPLFIQASIVHGIGCSHCGKLPCLHFRAQLDGDTC